MALPARANIKGFFLLPNQQDGSTVEGAWDFRHVNLHLTGAYAFTLGDVGPGWTGTVDLRTQGIYVDGSGEPRLYANGQGFEDAMVGVPSGGDYVVATGRGATGVDDVPIDPMPLVGEQQ